MTNEDLKDLEQAIAEQAKLSGFSGCILISEKGRQLYTGAFGFANIPDEIPNEIGTRFAVASGSKAFTAVAVLQLIDQGRISLETPIKAVVDAEFPNFSLDLKVRHLLTHSSGIKDYFDEAGGEDYENIWKDRPVYNYRMPRDFLPLFRENGQHFAPGEKFSYNNAAFIILAIMIEDLAHMPFLDYIQSYIFEPADMTRSGYFCTELLPEKTARGYIVDTDGRMRSNIFALPVVGSGDGGAYTTAEDMDKFWSALLGQRLLSPTLTELIVTPQIEAREEGDNLWYGLGVWLRREQEKTLSYYVTGWDPGVAMISEYLVDSGHHVCLLSNQNDGVFQLYRSILSRLR